MPVVSDFVQGPWSMFCFIPHWNNKLFNSISIRQGPQVPDCIQNLTALVTLMLRDLWGASHSLIDKT